MRILLVPALILALAVSSLAAFYGLQEAKVSKRTTAALEARIEALVQLQLVQRQQFLKVLQDARSTETDVRELVLATPDFSSTPTPSSIVERLCRELTCKAPAAASTVR